MTAGISVCSIGYGAMKKAVQNRVKGDDVRATGKAGGRFTERYVTMKIEKSLWRDITHASY